MAPSISNISLAAGLLLLLPACKATRTTTAVPPARFIETILQQNPAAFGTILQQREERRVQIIYTRIDRDAGNQPVFTDFYFNTEPDRYFYPASAVKMPLAFLALEKLHRLGIPRNATFITETASPEQTAVFNDPTAPDGRPTVEHYIKKIFITSDNDASNRLYEFLGQEYLHEQLRQKGYPEAQILHRLSVSLPGAANRRTNPVRFLTPDGKPLYSQPPAESRLNYLPRTDSVGKGYMDGNTQVNQPMDFSGKNRVHLADLHRMLQTVLFPEAFPEQQRFRFSEDDYRFLYQCLSQLPRETRYPEYDTTHYYDSYVKFFLYGTQKQTRIPPTIRIFNKVGWSYGFLTDVAYIADLQNGVEFMLSATIYCNADGILNDDRYEYETVGLPFLEALGRQFYEHELQRKKKRQPDLSRFRLQYEK